MWIYVVQTKKFEHEIFGIEKTLGLQLDVPVLEMDLQDGVKTSLVNQNLEKINRYIGVRRFTFFRFQGGAKQSFDKNRGHVVTTPPPTTYAHAQIRWGYCDITNLQRLYWHFQYNLNIIRFESMKPLGKTHFWRI